MTEDIEKNYGPFDCNILPQVQSFKDIDNPFEANGQLISPYENCVRFVLDEYVLYLKQGNTWVNISGDKIT